METIVQTFWTKAKVLVKALIIGGIVLILQIPTFFIQDLIKEREQRQKEAIAEVSGKWAGKQNITGPVLVLPYWQAGADTSIKNMTKHFAYYLPDELLINASVNPEEKHRGIYKVMLYTSKVNMKGRFGTVAPEKLKIDPRNIIWNEAFVHINISDVKGLNDELKLQWNNQTLAMSPDAVDGTVMSDGLNAPLNLTGIDDVRSINFSADINLSGSEELLFTPVGKSTSVNMSAKWPHPSFTGDILPSTKNIGADSFYANWKSVSQKRSFPQQWKDHSFLIVNSKSPKQGDAVNNIKDNSFGASLYVPVSGYQKNHAIGKIFFPVHPAYVCRILSH